MFKFDFEGESGEDSHNVTDDAETQALTLKPKLKWAEASEVLISQKHLTPKNSNLMINYFTCGNYKLLYLRPDVKKLNDNDVLEAEHQHSDLIPGVYEGGFKIWECSYDLANFIREEISSLFHPGAFVLDLGCGAGLLGLLALHLGCTVHFQDYNASVLNSFTIPNVLLNFNEDEISKCQFFSGDWTSFVEYTKSKSILFDIILTSETIYNSDNYSKLQLVFKEKLKKSGRVFLSAKTCYFGVGGNIRQFENFLSEEGVLSSVCRWKSNKGVQREILEIRFANRSDQ